MVTTLTPEQVSMPMRAMVSLHTHSFISACETAEGETPVSANNSKAQLYLQALATGLLGGGRNLHIPIQHPLNAEQWDKPI